MGSFPLWRCKNKKSLKAPSLTTYPLVNKHGYKNNGPFFKGVSYWKNVFCFHGFLSLCWILRSPTVGFVNFPCSQTSDPVSFLDDTDRFWGWWYIPNCQMLNKLPRSSSFVVSILHFQGYQLSKLAWKHGRPEVIYSMSIGEKGMSSPA